jgi:hypothetical protein
MHRAALRLVMVDEPASAPSTSGARRPGSLRCTYKAPDDDFFCWKFQLWYPSIDCAYRVQHQTCEPCSDCAQGRRNLELRAPDLSRRRWIGETAS